MRTRKEGNTIAAALYTYTGNWERCLEQFTPGGAGLRVPTVTAMARRFQFPPSAFTNQNDYS